MPQLLVPLSGVLLLIGGLSILTGYRPKIGIAAIVLFFVPVTLMMHNFWTVEELMMRMVELHSFLANVGLAASAIMFLAIPKPWPASLTLNRPVVDSFAGARQHE